MSQNGLNAPPAFAAITIFIQARLTNLGYLLRLLVPRHTLIEPWSGYRGDEEKALPGLSPIELILCRQHHAALRSNAIVCSAAHISTGQP